MTTPTTALKRAPERPPYLSHSQIRTFEQCPAQYEHRYIRKSPRHASAHEATGQGRALHAALETILGEHVAAERNDRVDREGVHAAWRAAWLAEGLCTHESFVDGEEVLTRWAEREDVLDSHDVLALEQRFEIEVEGLQLVGVIDRVDRLGDVGIEVADYKSSRIPMRRDAVEQSLQLSIYAMAARERWPWAERIVLSFDLLRHGVRIRTERTDTQLDAARRYIVAIAEQIASTTTFEARLNPNCAFCAYRDQCSAFADALESDEQPAAVRDFPHAAAERERLGHRIKILSTRRSELSEVIEAHLQRHGDASAAGMRYRLSSVRKLEYPIEHTVQRLAASSACSAAEVRSAVCKVDPKALASFVRAMAKTTPRADMARLKAELDAMARVDLSHRLHAKDLRS